MLKRICRRWTKEEDDYIRANYKTLSVRDIAKNLERTEKATRNRIERLGIRICNLERNNRKWTDEEISILKKNIHKTNSELAKILKKRTASAICQKRRELGLSKPRPYWKYTYEGYLIRRDGKGGKILQHREIVERMLGRKLKPTERVHHINGKKDDNRKENLYLCRNNTHHKLVHFSLEEVAYKLVEKGIIKFNKQKGMYEI